MTQPYHGKHGKRWQRGKRWNGRMWISDGEPMKVQTYRVFYRFENDDTEYSALIDETSAEHAAAALLHVEPVIIIRVELIS